MGKSKTKTKNEALASTDSTSITNIEVKDSLGGICRLCTTCDGIFTSVIDKRNENIKNWILNCLSIQIDDNDALPKTICHRCLFFLEMFQEFVEILSKKLKTPNKVNCFVCPKESDRNLVLGAPIVSRKLQICIPQFQMKNLEKNTNKLCKSCYCKLDFLTDLKKKACESKLFFSETEVNSYIQTNTKSKIVPTINTNKIIKKLSNVKDIVKTDRIKINPAIKRDSKMYNSVSTIVLPDIIKLENLAPDCIYVLTTEDEMNLPKRGLKRKNIESDKNKSKESLNGIWQVSSSSIINVEHKRPKRNTTKSITNDKTVSPVMKFKKMKTESTSKIIIYKNQQKKGSTADTTISLEDSFNSDDNSSVSSKPRSSTRSSVVNVVTAVKNVSKPNRKRKLDTVTKKDSSNSISMPKVKSNIAKKTKGPKSKTKIKIRMSFPGLTNKSKPVNITPYRCQYCDLSFPSTCEGKAHEMNNHNKSLTVKLNPVTMEENTNENSNDLSEHGNQEELTSKSKRIKKVHSVRFFDLENSNVDETQNSEKEINETDVLEVLHLKKSTEEKEHEVSTNADERSAEPDQTCESNTLVEENCISGELRLSVDDEQDAHDDIDDDDAPTADVIEISDVDDSKEKTLNKKEVVLNQDKLSANENDEDLVEIQDDVSQVDLTEDSQDEVQETIIEPISEENISEVTDIVVTDSTENSESTEVANALIETQDENIQELTINKKVDPESHDANGEKNNLKSNSAIDNEAEEPKKDNDVVLDINSDVNADGVSDKQEPTALSDEIQQSEQCAALEEQNELNRSNKEENIEERHTDVETNAEDGTKNSSKTIDTEFDIVDDQVTNEDTEIIEQVVETEESEDNSIAIEEDTEKNDVTVSENEETRDTAEVSVDTEEVSIDTVEVSIDTEEVSVGIAEVSVDNEGASVVYEEDSCNIVETSEDNEGPLVDEALIIEHEITTDDNLTEIEETVKNNVVLKNDESGVSNAENAAKIDITHKKNGKATKNPPHDKSLEDLIAELEN